MEAKEDGETVRIYGIDDGNKLRDIILYSSDGSLISMSGSIGLEHVGELMKQTK